MLFEPIDFVVGAGEIVQVVGPNGAGKTTLLRSLCGLFSDYQGDIGWQGKKFSPTAFEFLQDLFYLGHHPGVKKFLTAEENLRWYFDLQGDKPALDLSQLLQKVGLAGYDHVPCQQMSAGQMRRVALARLYGTQRKLWILDEPFTAIDIKGVAELEALLQRHVAEGGTVILTTHQALGLTGVRSLILNPPTARDE